MGLRIIIIIWFYSKYLNIHRYGILDANFSFTQIAVILTSLVVNIEQSWVFCSTTRSIFRRPERYKWVMGVRLEHLVEMAEVKLPLMAKDVKRGILQYHLLKGMGVKLVSYFSYWTLHIHLGLYSEWTNGLQ